ncbi:MAG: prephenate dehydratase domain-containing protein, partial [Lachnospiraceae bacterium]|nr:prephenate dehydratase domain-containing protein [Lachnospiraceae bacterium]
MNFFGDEGNYIPYTTVSETVDALLAGNSDYAVIPQENTIGGPVIDYVDTLISQKDVSIVGEIELPIRQNLLGIAGTDLSDIQTVYSHKQGILQGANWLQENIPQAEVIEVSSTAEGAKMVSESQDPSEAAIASAACVPVYQLEMLAESIQENDNNVT